MWTHAPGTPSPLTPHTVCAKARTVSETLPTPDCSQPKSARAGTSNQHHIALALKLQKGGDTDHQPAVHTHPLSVVSSRSSFQANSGHTAEGPREQPVSPITGSNSQRGQRTAGIIQISTRGLSKPRPADQPSPPPVNENAPRSSLSPHTNSWTATA